MSVIQILVIAVTAALVLGIIVNIIRGRDAAPAADPSAPYGTRLVSRVADRLERGDVLCYRHRDYCGIGLRFVKPWYIYGEAFDGVVLTPDDLRTSGTNPATIEHLVFGSRGEFVAWLTAQADETLSGSALSEWLRGNQRITRSRLEAFARGEPVPDA